MLAHALTALSVEHGTHISKWTSNSEQYVVGDKCHEYYLKKIFKL